MSNFVCWLQVKIKLSPQFAMVNKTRLVKRFLMPRPLPSLDIGLTRIPSYGTEFFRILSFNLSSVSFCFSEWMLFYTFCYIFNSVSCLNAFRSARDFCSRWAENKKDILFFSFFLPNDRFSICKVFGSDYWLIIISYPNCRERSVSEKKIPTNSHKRALTDDERFFFLAGKHGTLIQFGVRIMFVNLAILRIVKDSCQSQRNGEMPASQLLL